MGLIIKDKMPGLIKGYPTVSDKYNVTGAVITGNTDIKFGDPLVWVDGVANPDGYYVKSGVGVGAITAADDFAGFAISTNVKLAEGFPGTEVLTKPGEAVNLLINGYIAVEFDSAETVANIKPNAKVYITANGALTTANAGNANFDTGYKCTGFYEDHGTAAAHKYIVEVFKA